MGGIGFGGGGGGCNDGGGGDVDGGGEANVGEDVTVSCAELTYVK